MQQDWPSPFEETVNGVIIGEMTWPYEFWQDNSRVARGLFENGTVATKWFEMNYPELFAQGAEMRVFEGGPLD
jgi:hypothetical protein